MTRNPLTITPGLRGSELLAELQGKVEALATQQSGAGDVTGDESRAGLIYSDTTAALVKQVDLAGTDHAVLWTIDGAPMRMLGATVENSDSPYQPDATKVSWLLVDASSGAVVIDLQNVPLAGDGTHLFIVKTDTSTNTVTVEDSGTGELPAEGGWNGSGDSLVLAKADDRVELIRTAAANQPDLWTWYFLGLEREPAEDHHERRQPLRRGAP